jgi:hypothetical protein
MSTWTGQSVIGCDISHCAVVVLGMCYQSYCPILVSVRSWNQLSSILYAKHRCQIVAPASGCQLSDLSFPSERAHLTASVHTRHSTTDKCVLKGGGG